MTLVRVTDRDDYVAGFDTRPMLLSRDMNPTRWIPPLESAVLEANEVHVWKVPLHASPSRLAALRDALSPEEHLRSHIYRFQEDRQRFVVARGLLRTILARYLHANPGELCFAVSQIGKPELHPDLNSGIRFSLSYSGNRAVFALTQRCDVGVDIEQVRADYPVDCVAELFFSDQEQARFRSLPACLRRRAFFACWCRKEAMVKALGYGLPLGLDRPEVSMALGEPVRPLSTHDLAVKAQEWSIVDLAVGDEYAGAVAVKMPSPILRYWDASEI